MDRYDALLSDIVEKTESDQLRWMVVDPASDPEFLYLGERIRRAYLADYPLGNRRYRVLFLERRSPVGDEPEPPILGDRFVAYVLDPDDGMLVQDLYDGLVERSQLMNLAALIEGRNDRTRELFSAFAEAHRPSSSLESPVR